MGLDDFIKEEKTSSPTEASGPSRGGVDDFLDDEGKIEVEGGFTIEPDNEDSKDTEVVKIFGGPGTGKTTTMVGNTDINDFRGILQRMFESRSPDELMLIAYTRAAADEAKERLVSLTDVTQSKADERVTTIHSLAMSFNSLTPKDIVEIRWANDKYNFCQKVGMEYKMNADEDQEDMMAVPDDDGHLFFQIHSWLKSKLKPYEELNSCPLASSWEREDEEFVEFAEEWEQYKSNKGIWEFDDAILESVNNNDTVDAKYLFVDEVQDLYPLQQAFLDNQFGHVDRIFLAGDDDQTIYEWAGAKPEYFLNMEGKVNKEMPQLWKDKEGYWEDEGVYILDQSWRMPNEILKLAKMAIDKVDERQEKSIKPHHDGGEFIPLRNPDDERIVKLINPDDTMILFRAKYQMSQFGQTLIDYGVPFKDRFNSRHTISRNRLLDKVRYVDPSVSGHMGRWTSKLEHDDLNYYRTQAVKHNIRQDKEHLDPEGVEIETIHGSKGQEADTIILFTDSTQSVMENMPPGGMKDAERRLYYVGVTRTENRLVMCEGWDEDSPVITLDTIFGPEWREHTPEWSNGTVYVNVDNSKQNPTRHHVGSDGESRTTLSGDAPKSFNELVSDDE